MGGRTHTLVKVCCILTPLILTRLSVDDRLKAF